MPAETLRVRGYREFMRAARRATPSTRKKIRAALREAGESVRSEGERRFALYDRRSAAGYRISVRQRGIFVVQSLRKTTGLRPDYGALQMRKGLLPALYHKQNELEHDVEMALDRIADEFGI